MPDLLIFAGQCISTPAIGGIKRYPVITGKELISVIMKNGFKQQGHCNNKCVDQFIERGTSTVNIDPMFSSQENEMELFNISIYSFTIFSPRPVPYTDPVLSALKNLLTNGSWQFPELKSGKL